MEDTNDFIIKNGELIKYRGNGGDVVIPNGVTRIRMNTFSGCTEITSITIPESVTKIGNEAFYGCTRLTKVNITSIASWCKISFTDSYSNPLEYAHKLYLNDEEITELVIPDGVTTINRCAFCGCTGFTDITIPDSVACIGIGAFENTVWLEKQPDGIVYAGKVCYRFKGKMPDNYVAELTPGTVSIAGCAFYSCAELKDIIIPDSLTKIDEYAFSGCTGLTNITIPDGVTTISKSAFNGCTGLTDITIPDSVTRIGTEAFDNTAWLNNHPNGIVYAGKICYQYKGKMPEGYSVELNPGTVGIGDRVFNNCTNLKSITIPNSVTNIGNSAFDGCFGLKETTVPDNVTKIKAFTFSDCIGLNSITIPDSVTTIGLKAFYGCLGLKSVSIPDSVTSIGSWAFSSCTGLTDIAIPDSVTNIGNWAFIGCDNLTIHAPAGSYAEEYAQDEGIPFVAEG